MSYLECPNCGQKALSVATQCPRCHAPFEAPPPPRRPPTPPSLIVGVAVLILIIVGGIARKLEISEGNSSAPASSPSSAPGRAAKTEAVAPAPTATDSLRPAITDSVATPVPPTHAAAPAAPPAPTATPAPAPPPPTHSETGERRYANTWVNVRAGPSGRAAIVRILQPGESVQVDSLREGWYQVLANGGPGGYVDGNLVDRDRPSPNP